MTTFTNIINQLHEDTTKRINDRAFYIVHGYMPTWNENERKESDRGLKQYSTETRWNQYTSGKIDRETATGYAIKRATREIEKDLEKKLEKLERVSNAADLDYMSICVEFKRSRYYGSTPTATVNDGHRRTTGTASGYGYDKESAAVASALNENDSVLKALYTYKENKLAQGENDTSSTACTGHDNRNIIAYGAGYDTLPYFEGGVGVNCFLNIFGLLGFECHADYSGKHTNYYTFTRKTA